MNWECDNCEYATTDFNKVWDHCKGVSHTMHITKRREN